MSMFNCGHTLAIPINYKKKPDSKGVPRMKPFTENGYNGMPVSNVVRAFE